MGFIKNFREWLLLTKQREDAILILDKKWEASMSDEYSASAKDIISAIERTRQEMSLGDPEEINKIVASAIDCHWGVRFPMVRFQYKLLEAAHKNEGWRKRWSLRKKIGSEQDLKAHIKECKNCSDFFAEAIRQMNSLFKEYQ